MMKLTVAFLASLAAADAAGARRGDGGYGTGNHGTGVLPSHSAPYTDKTPEAVETAFPTHDGYAVSSHVLDETVDHSTAVYEHPDPSSAPEAEESKSYPVYEGTGGIPTFKFTGTGEHPHPTGRPHHGTGRPHHGTGVEDVTSAAYPVKTPESEIEHVTTKTLVYTVGTGGHAHPVTTEIVETSTETVYKTIFVTRHGHGETPVETAIPTHHGHGGDHEEEGTTTLKTTSTTTKFITVYPTPSGDVTGEEVSPAHGGQGGPHGGQGAPNGGEGEHSQGEHGQGEHGGCGAPVTVTVTAQETVTVTETEYPEHTPVEHSVETEVPHHGHPHGEHDITKTFEHPIPTEFPTSSYSANTTYPFPTGPSGFLTHTKPAYPHGTGVSDHELPSEYPSHTGTPIEETEKPEYPSYPESSPVEEAEQSAYPTAPPAAGEDEYGYY